MGARAPAAGGARGAPHCARVVTDRPCHDCFGRSAPSRVICVICVTRGPVVCMEAVGTSRADDGTIASNACDRAIRICVWAAATSHRATSARRFQLCQLRLVLLLLSAASISDALALKVGLKFTPAITAANVAVMVVVQPIYAMLASRLPAESLLPCVSLSGGAALAVVVFTRSVSDTVQASECATARDPTARERLSTTVVRPSGQTSSRRTR